MRISYWSSDVCSSDLEIVQENREAFAADVFLASDGPRVNVERANINLGNRGAVNFDLHVDLREGGHHSGNWGGLLANPGIILAHVLATLRSEEHPSELQSLMRISYAVFCLKKQII